MRKSLERCIALTGTGAVIIGAVIFVSTLIRHFSTKRREGYPLPEQPCKVVYSDPFGSATHSSQYVMPNPAWRQYPIWASEVKNK